MRYVGVMKIASQKLIHILLYFINFCEYVVNILTLESIYMFRKGMITLVDNAILEIHKLYAYLCTSVNSDGPVFLTTSSATLRNVYLIVILTF
jgi:hypothetical protein